MKAELTVTIALRLYDDELGLGVSCEPDDPLRLHDAVEQRQHQRGIPGPLRRKELSEMSTKRRAKLTLHRETLRLLERTGPVDQVNTSCIDSCYLVSCGGGCGISEGAAE